MDKEIGGYFSLELSLFDNMPHKDGILVNSGRNALEYIFRSLPRIDCLVIPYFTCDSILEPLEKLSLKYKFYHINENLELADEIELASNEYLVYSNYFGIKDEYVKYLDYKYKDQLIVDNAQALFAPETQKCAFSPRKFVGIPDGGIAFTNGGVPVSINKKDESYTRCSHLLRRIDQSATAGYLDFRENSKLIKNQPILQMSALTRALIQNIDFSQICRQRLSNYKYLSSKLDSRNLLNIPKNESFACPLVYPLMIENGADMKKKLIENKIFVASYWPNVLQWCNSSSLEYNLTQNIIPIPIDQRYTIEDMEYILNFL